MEGITAEHIVELFERDVRARRRLALLLASEIVSEPEARMALVNAVLREVATKQDLGELRRELRDVARELREYTDKRLAELKEYVDKRFIELKEYVDKRLAEMKDYVDKRFGELRAYVDIRFAEFKAYVDKRFDRLEAEVRELRDRLWWVVATVILGWIGAILTQLLLIAR